MKHFADLICKEHYQIRTYDIDSNKRITIPALIKLMQETAMQNVINLKLSVWDLEPHHISWVLMRMQLHINRLPILGEKITIVTHPAGFEKFFTYRDYKVYDSTDNLIAYSSSTWLLMDTVKRKMARIPDFILMYEPPDAPEFLERPKRKLPVFETTHHNRLFHVGYHDLDFNQHLNNVVYIRWMLETFQDDTLKNRRLKKLDIIYRLESAWRDEINAQLQVLNINNSLHRLIRTSDNKELASAHCVWE